MGIGKWKMLKLSLRSLPANCAGDADGQPVNIPAPLTYLKE